jgi:NAD(P)-dependent dehydrogenase (short-subunit alcohol dehydrogenase family)
MLSNRTGSVESEASAILSEAKSAIGRWKSFKDGVVNSLKINSDNPGTRVDITSLSSSVSDMDRKATELSALYDKLKQYGAGDMLLNIAEFRQLKSKLSDVSDGAAYLDGIRNDYKTNAQGSLNDARTFIDQRMSNASAEEKQVLTSLQPLLITAKDSYDSGLYLDSMVLTDHIRNRIASYKATPQPIVDPLIIYVVIVVLASAAVVMLLFRKEGPKSPRLIERVKLD